MMINRVAEMYNLVNAKPIKRTNQTNGEILAKLNKQLTNRMKNLETLIQKKKPYFNELVDINLHVQFTSYISNMPIEENAEERIAVGFDKKDTNMLEGVKVPPADIANKITQLSRRLETCFTKTGIIKKKPYLEIMVDLYLQLQYLNYLSELPIEEAIDLVIEDEIAEKVTYDFNEATLWQAEMSIENFEVAMNEKTGACAVFRPYDFKLCKPKYKRPDVTELLDIAA